MPVFKLAKDKLHLIKEKRFKLEKDLQTLTENNLEEIFGIEFVASEFMVEGLYIDTLCFNPETKSFVIIEYKREKNFSVIDQGFSYLSLMVTNKAEFILEYNEKNKGNLKRDEVDWSQSRVYFVSPSFTTHQQNAINFKDLPFELWEVTRYENDFVLFNQIKADNKTESIKNLGVSKEISKVTSEVKEYTEEHVIGTNKKVKDLYASLKAQIELIDSRIVPNPVNNYIGFKLPDNWRIIFNVRKSWKSKETGYGLAIEFSRSEPSDYKDPENRLEYIKNSMKYYNQHLSRMYVYDNDDVEYASLIIKQAVEKFADRFYVE